MRRTALEEKKGPKVGGEGAEESEVGVGKVTELVEWGVGEK